jgi:molecular chaperone HtpG
MAQETRSFEAEVTKLLHIVANSLYSDKETFLRELISNASDACDRLRYAAITHPGLSADDPDLRITIDVDKKARTIRVSDNGIGMNHDELIENLGTIARSGTSAFMDHLSGDDNKDVALIGQFGVGFYSAFTVSDHVEVISRKAGEDQAWLWSSDGQGSYEVSEAEREGRGTDVVLTIRKAEKDFVEAARLHHIIKRFSDHIAIPIRFADGVADSPVAAGEKLNEASALWTRQKKDITAEQYTEFYRHSAHSFDEPWLTLHARAEGKIEYTLLLFVPSARPFDLFSAERRHRLKLYVKRVFITDDLEGLLPPWLRFVRGVVDAEDLPLNISREVLQSSPLVTRISKALVKRLLNELGKKADKAPEEFATFWGNFGAVIKEGIYEDADQREALLKLARFHTTRSGDKLNSLADYVAGLAEGQKSIFYITGDDLDALRKSPQIEGFAARGIEVLLLTDPVDDFWIASGFEYEDHAFKSITRGDTEFDEIKAPDDKTDEAEAGDEGALSTLIAHLKLTLGEAVKDVRTTDRLTDSPVCLVADDQDIDMHLARLLKAQGQDIPQSPRVLELNPRHDLIKTLATAATKDGAGENLADAAYLLLDQARIIEGEIPEDPAAFSRRLADVMARGIGG